MPCKYHHIIKPTRHTGLQLRLIVEQKGGCHALWINDCLDF